MDNITTLLNLVTLSFFLMSIISLIDSLRRLYKSPQKLWGNPLKRTLFILVATVLMWISSNILLQFFGVELTCVSHGNATPTPGLAAFGFLDDSKPDINVFKYAKDSQEISGLRIFHRQFKDLNDTPTLTNHSFEELDYIQASYPDLHPTYDNENVFNLSQVFDFENITNKALQLYLEQWYLKTDEGWRLLKQYRSECDNCNTCDKSYEKLYLDPGHNTYKQVISWSLESDRTIPPGTHRLLLSIRDNPLKLPQEYYYEFEIQYDN